MIYNTSYIYIIYTYNINSIYIAYTHMYNVYIYTHVSLYAVLQKITDQTKTLSQGQQLARQKQKHRHKRETPALYEQEVIEVYTHGISCEKW